MCLITPLLFLAKVPKRGLTTFSYRPNVKVEYLNFYFISRLLIGTQCIDLAKFVKNQFFFSKKEEGRL
jgi:hypothetical protein